MIRVETPQRTALNRSDSVQHPLHHGTRRRRTSSNQISVLDASLLLMTLVLALTGLVLLLMQETAQCHGSPGAAESASATQMNSDDDHSTQPWISNDDSDALRRYYNVTHMETLSLKDAKITVKTADTDKASAAAAAVVNGPFLGSNEPEPSVMPQDATTAPDSSGPQENQEEPRWSLSGIVSIPRHAWAYVKSLGAGKPSSNATKRQSTSSWTDYFAWKKQSPLSALSEYELSTTDATTLDHRLYCRQCSMTCQGMMDENDNDMDNDEDADTATQ